MAGLFQEVTLGDFEAYIGPCSALGAKEVDLGTRTKEYVYERAVTTSSGVDYPFKIRIYTSIDQRGDFCREKGKDAIRVLLVDARGTVVMKATRINRVGDTSEVIMERVLDRCRELFRYAITPANRCPKCDVGMLVERKYNQAKHKKYFKTFNGCHNFRSGCKGSSKA